MLLGSRLNAQTADVNFFKSASVSSLSSEAITTLDNLRASSSFDTVLLFEVEPLQQVLQGNQGFLKMIRPVSYDTSYLIRTKHLEMRTNGDYLWEGTFENIEGSALLLSKDGEVFGNFTIEEQAYELYALGNHFSALASRIYPDEDTLWHCPMDHVNPRDTTPQSPPVINIPDDLPQVIESTEDVCKDEAVRILVLYTQAAEQAMSNPEHTALMAIANMNRALRNSQIRVRVKLVGTAPLFDFVETTDITILPAHPTAQILRDNYEADLVVLFTNGISGNYLNYGGSAAAIGPDIDSAYAIVQAKYALAPTMFAHEVGHLFGARHQASADPVGTYQHAYEFKTGWIVKTTRVTVMHTPYLPRKKKRYISYYSNPDVSFKGKATGTPSANNSLKLQESYEIIKYFRPHTDVTVSILGPDVLADNETGLWTAAYCIDASVGEPVSYLWECSFGGYSYVTIGTGATVTLTMPPNLPFFSLRLTINFSSGGLVGTGFLVVSNPTFSIEPPFGRTSEAVAKPHMTAYPNPASHQIACSYPMPVAGEVSVTLRGLEHQNLEEVLTLFEGRMGEGQQQQRLDVADIPDGIYLLSVITPVQSFIQRVFIEK